jgi:hypothetical protein
LLTECVVGEDEDDETEDGMTQDDYDEFESNINALIADAQTWQEENECGIPDL